MTTKREGSRSSGGGWVVAVVAVGLVVGAGCAPRWTRAPHDRFFQRTASPRLHHRPRTREVSEWHDRGWHAVARPLSHLISPAYHVMRISGGIAALDVNNFGQVPDSTWFRNRINRVPMSRWAMRRGPNVDPPPAGGELVVVAGKSSGVTPGLIVRDTRGARWLIKFDPPAFPELASGAEAVSTKLLHAAGYYVPQNHIIDLDLSRLRLAPGATTVDGYNRKVELDKKRLQALIEQLNPHRGGSLRCLFSRIIEGLPIGPFDYNAARPDDPNDRFPHWRRRSLRGLWVFAAWINHTETRQTNSYDTFIVVDRARELGFVRHYLLDFGSTFGSRGVRPKPRTTGYVYRLDWGFTFARLFAFGLYYPYWIAVQKSPYRSIGVFEADVFKPASWRPVYPNPAFEQATKRDTYWAASILAWFTPTLIRAAVETGRFSEPGAAEWVEGALLLRRRKLLLHAFADVLPLDMPRVTSATHVGLTDLAVSAELVEADEVRYHWTLTWNRTGLDRTIARGQADRPEVDLAAALAKARGRAGFKAQPYLTLTWRRGERGRIQALSPEVALHLRDTGAELLLAGLTREVD